MITKFSNLEDFFNFLELKRAEIAKDFGIKNCEDKGFDFESSQISETIIEMTTDELNEIEIASEKQEFNSLLIQEDSIDDGIINESIILNDKITIRNDYTITHVTNSQKSLNQMAWSCNFETPVKATDTTIIMEQLNLNFDDCIDDDLIDFEEPLQDVTDPLGLDSLIFPISQFPNEDETDEVDENNEIDENDDFLDEIISVFEEETKSNDSDFDFDIPMSQFPSTQTVLASPPKDFQATFVTGRGVKLPPPSEAALKKAAQLDTNEGTDGFVGFKTGRGMEMPAPSKEAMKRARSLVEFDEISSKTGDVPLFTTGRDKFMPPSSDEAMKRTKSLIEEDYNNAKPIVGFSTGRGIALPPPSEEALDRANKIFDNFDENKNILSVGFTTGRGKALPPPSEEALASANMLIDNFNDTPPVISNIGFSTGKGKTLPAPSDEAMKKAANLIGATNNNKKSLVPGNSAFKPPSLIKTESSLKPPPKPFALSTVWKRPRNLMKTASASTSSITKTPPVVKIEPIKLFDLNTDGMQRFKLKDFFKTTPNLKISNYSSFGICENILKLTSESAKYFKFPDGWGVNEAHQNLVQNGAQGISISLDWTANHYRWIIWKFASFLRCFPEKYSIANLSPGWVLQQLLYRYEREINQCSRSALKKIIERDDAAGKYLCLMVANIDNEGKCIELSDGWYSIWTNKLENSFWDLIVNKKIFEGIKIEIFGASLTGGQDGIPALDASVKGCNCHLIISRNSCRPARWDTKLGFIYKSVAFLKHLNQIHSHGGAIPAISLIIDRVYPLLYREDTVDNNHVTRNEKDHYLYLETNSEQASNSKYSPIQRIKVIGNCEIESNALISFWNPIGEDQRSLLQEGSCVLITNLRSNSKSSSKLTLVSTKSTRIFKDEKIIQQNFKSSIVKIDLENYFLLSNLKLNEFFDVQGVALGKVGAFFWICGMVYNNNSPNFLICLKNFNYNFNRGEIINFRDLTFNHFDSREGVAHFTFTEYSDFKKDPNKVTAVTVELSIKRFNELTQNNV